MYSIDNIIGKGVAVGTAAAAAVLIASSPINEGLSVDKVKNSSAAEATQIKKYLSRIGVQNVSRLILDPENGSFTFRWEEDPNCHGTYGIDNDSKAKIETVTCD